MNSEQAKVILACYRPAVDDASDPQVAAALRLAQTDPALAAWYAAQQAIDAAVHRKLTEIPIPPGLQTRLLSQRPATKSSVTWLGWWRLPAVSSLAALLLAGFIFLQALPTSFRAYRHEMVEFVDKPYTLDFEVDDLAQARQLMKDSGYPSDYVLPGHLSDYPLEGGCKRSWRGEKVSLLCFGEEDEGKPDVWLFFAPADKLPGSRSDSDLRYTRVDEMITATWVADGIRYLAVAEADEMDLQGMLQPAAGLN